MNRTLTLLCLVLGSFPLASRGTDAPALKPLALPDVLAWKGIRAAGLSPDGQWLAYQLAPNEGNSELVLRATKCDKELRFPIGELRGFGPRNPLAPVAFSSPELAFSDDSRWMAFTIHPPKPPKARPPSAKPPRNKVALVNLATGAKLEFDNVQRFTFSGESAGWLALHRYPPETTAPPAEKWTGSDLILRELAGGAELNTGNVAEFAFDKKGRWLALVIDAEGQSGNGVQLRDLPAGRVRVLDSGKAFYKALGWTDHSDGLAVLKGASDKAFEDKLYSVLGFTDLASRTPRKTIFDPAADKTFPAGMAVSPNRNPTWSEDLTTLLFGIHKLHKKDPGAKPEPGKDTSPAVAAGPRGQQAPPGAPRGAAAAEESDENKPDLVLWHWTDDRLQSEQQVQATADRHFSYLCLYQVKNGKFLRLADRPLHQVTPVAHQRWAIGQDNRDYRLSGTLDGRRYHDLYVVDLQTGERRLAAKKNRWYYGPCPEGRHFLYYDDCHFYTCDLATGQTYNITREVPACFVDTEDDHNVTKPPVPPLGWVKGGQSVLLSDGWDVWNVPVHGGKGVNLTVNGRQDGLRYRTRFLLDPDEKGIDLTGPVYFSVYGEWTKKSGIVRIEDGQSGPERLLWDDAAFGGLLKAKKADVFAYTRETVKDYPDYCVADRNLREGRRLTHANPQQEKFLWSKGSILVNYTSAKGAKLQAALFLPAHYEEHKRYPTVVYIYEKLSAGLNRYPRPAATGFNPAVYTSRGYAVLMPDIVYQINDPGRSAVWCVLPALEAAIATGVVDRERVGLHGHSWGGYQTAFLITQTDAFKAAAAGAPLTNLISMYSSIYWNTGSANQPIFESSQGRFTGGYWEDFEAYTRNSPIYHAKNVKTPLLLLHNDKDGAVDWNQGIEYFNTLRRLRKPVVLLQYKGENHGLVKPANQKDYTVRMQEFFDHHLRDQPAPGWLKEGVPHLELKDHLRERLKDLP